jgi:putative ABC transport system permease protein
MLRNYVKVAWRNLLRRPTISLIHVLGLSLGILSCLVIFLVTRFELSFDKGQPDADRIYRMTSLLSSRIGGEPHPISTIPDPGTPAVRAELTGLSAVTFFHTWSTNVLIPRTHKKFEPRKQGEVPPDIVITDPDYFSVFPAKWLVGSPRGLADPNKVVLTLSQARRYFGDIPLTQMMGQDVIYEDSLHVAVSGVIADQTLRTDRNFDDFISFATVAHTFLSGDIDMSNWGMWSGASQTFVKLSPGTTAAQVERQLSAFAKKHVRMHEGDKAEFHLQPLQDIHFNGTFHDTYSRQAHLPTLYGLMAIALFILIIACINFINLSTAQSVQRAKEIGVRKVLGSGKKSLVFQFLSETMLLTLLAVLVSLLLVQPTLAAFRGILPTGIRVDALQPSTLLFLLGLAVVTALCAGYYPARILSSFQPAISLKGQSGEKLNRKGFLRRALIVFQFSVSLVFIIGTIVVGKQIAYMLHTDLGFGTDAIVDFPTNRHYDRQQRDYLKTLIEGIPGVTMVSINGGTPSSERHNGTIFQYKGAKEAPEIKGEILLADSGYLRLFQMKLTAGRNLLATDTMTEMLVNETGARALGFRRPEDALGKIVDCGMGDTHNQKNLPIVGILADFHSQSLHAAIQPDFVVSSMDNVRSFSVKLDTKVQGTGHFENILKTMQADYMKVYPAEKFDYTFFDDSIARFYKEEQKTSRIIQTAMIVAIFISCMGLFGLATFTAQQRTKEVGIRKVMGATVPRIVILLCQDFVFLVGLSVVIASPLAWFGVHKWLQDYAYQVSVGAWIFVASGLAALVIALGTVSIQAIRVARANPVNSLRSE